MKALLEKVFSLKDLQRAGSGILSLMLPVLFLSACSSQPGVIRMRGEALGTFYALTVVAPPTGLDENKIRQLADEALDRVNTLMSTYKEDSELSRFNRHEEATPFPLSRESFEVFSIALTIAEESGGAFDITVGPLVNAWGFGPVAQGDPPSDELIQELLLHQGYEKLRLVNGNAVVKDEPRLYCDLSAVAKGYAVDLIAEAFEEAGILRYMVEVGGEMRVAGSNGEGHLWGLGIEKPQAGIRELELAVYLHEGSLATSGDYRNMYVHEGRRISHTIDPTTGYPIQHDLAAVSVIHPSCARADAYATALLVLGPEKGLALAEEKELAALFLIRNEGGEIQRKLTPQFEAYMAQR